MLPTNRARAPPRGADCRRCASVLMAHHDSPIRMMLRRHRSTTTKPEKDQRATTRFFDFQVLLSGYRRLSLSLPCLKPPSSNPDRHEQGSKETAPPDRRIEKANMCSRAERRRRFIEPDAATRGSQEDSRPRRAAAADIDPAEAPGQAPMKLGASVNGISSRRCRSRICLRVSRSARHHGQHRHAGRFCNHRVRVERQRPEMRRRP